MKPGWAGRVRSSESEAEGANKGWIRKGRRRRPGRESVSSFALGG